MNPLDVAFRRFFVYQIRRRQTKHAQCAFYAQKCSTCHFSDKMWTFGKVGKKLQYSVFTIHSNVHWARKNMDRQ